MTTTFSPEYRIADHAGFTVRHVNGDAASPQVDAYEEALSLLTEHNATCGNQDCAVYGGSIQRETLVELPELNVSNANAAILLTALGLDAAEAMSYGLSLDPKDALGRLLVAQALIGCTTVDAGVPATVEKRAGGGSLIDCGRAPGYVSARLGALAEIVDFCVAHDRRLQVC